MRLAIRHLAAGRQTHARPSAHPTRPTPARALTSRSRRQSVPEPSMPVPGQWLPPDSGASGLPFDD
eukprot:4668283-Lingulodinium_polyedra.AAC.1